MTRAGTPPQLFPLFGFDEEQLRANVIERKRERGLSLNGLSAETGVSRPMLAYYFAVEPRVPRERRKMIQAETVIKLMMWLGDYDIRDYLTETR